MAASNVELKCLPPMIIFILAKFKLNAMKVNKSVFSIEIYSIFYLIDLGNLLLKASKII